MVAEKSELSAKDAVEARFVRREDRDYALALLLVEVLFLQHANFVVCRIQAPVLNIDVQFWQIEVGANGVSVENAEPFVVAESGAVGGEPVGDETLAIGLHEGSGLGSDGFVEFDLSIEIAAIKKHFIKAVIAKRALEGLLAARVLLGGGFASAAGAFVPGAFPFEADGFADRGGSGMSGAPHVVLGVLVAGQIIKVLKMLPRGRPIG